MTFAYYYHLLLYYEQFVIKIKIHLPMSIVSMHDRQFMTLLQKRSQLISKIYYDKYLLFAIKQVLSTVYYVMS